MNEEEIEDAIIQYDLKNDDYYNFKTPKSTYALYCIIAIFKHKCIAFTKIKR